MASKIKSSCKIEASICLVRRSLKRLGFKYEKVPKKNPLKPEHMKRRAKLAEEWIGNNLINKNVVFTD